MSMKVLELTADESERPALNKIEGALTNERHVSLLVGPAGEDIIELPESVYQVLKQIIHLMSHGRAIFIVPENQMLTTQEAADLLDVSRTYIIKLLGEQKIPYTMVGAHRRIRVGDLMKYMRRHEAEQESALDEIARISQEMGLDD